MSSNQALPKRMTCGVCGDVDINWANMAKHSCFSGHKKTTMQIQSKRIHPQSDDQQAFSIFNSDGNRQWISMNQLDEYEETIEPQIECPLSITTERYSPITNSDGSLSFKDGQLQLYNKEEHTRLWIDLNEEVVKMFNLTAYMSLEPTVDEQTIQQSPSGLSTQGLELTGSSCDSDTRAASPSTHRRTRAMWSRNATVALINCFSENRDDFASKYITKETAWKKISSTLASRHYSFTGNQCCHKWESLKGQYTRDCKNLNEKNVQPTFEFYNQFHNIFKPQPIPSSERSISTSRTSEIRSRASWNREAVLALIECFRTYKTSYDSNNVAKSHTWRLIAIKMNDEGMHYSSTQCAGKWESLMVEYKKKKDNMNANRSTGAARVDFEFFDEFDDLFGQDPNITPQFSVSSSRPMSSPLSSSSSVLINPQMPKKRATPLDFYNKDTENEACRERRHKENEAAKRRRHAENAELRQEQIAQLKRANDLLARFLDRAEEKRRTSY